MADRASSHSDAACAHAHAHVHGTADAHGAVYHGIHTHGPGQELEQEPGSTALLASGPGLFMPVATGQAVATATDAARNGGFANKDEAGVPTRASPRWFTPLRMLLIFSFVNLFVFLDRGAAPRPGCVATATPPAPTLGSQRC
uniref:Uncharacterized protein n=1 Tax=Chlamydomonas euryale TaxID=1486919 RepID=A0A7R9V9F2_9CHLO|eukprot:366311-Chlamydomonas_euryale.AAC.1